ncbi:MAG: hypothetical protein C7B46_20290 [Sulfobacillus benefaciens]|uniref:Uncharacterized protein n=1 Tax=Sulfobacillus benefaciens TaxID=453960 RepID=A0A2T2WV24_9FIRM|nr:MAG: hypothetical protein C7B46_20290 [Sulfobacillus benefaciens]
MFPSLAREPTKPPTDIERFGTAKIGQFPHSILIYIRIYCVCGMKVIAVNDKKHVPKFPDEEVFVSVRGSNGRYWAPAHVIEQRSPTLAAALLAFLWALLGFLVRLSVRILAIAAVITFYVAVLFAAILVFAVLFSLG